jgi:PadR family transcriptional regulator PadR
MHLIYYEHSRIARTIFLAMRAVLFYYAEHMAREHLGDFELIVLLAVIRLGDNAYGVPVRREIELEEKGHVESWFSDPVPERGGRSKRYFRVQPLGFSALGQTQRELTAMWEGVDLKKARHA